MFSLSANDISTQGCHVLLILPTTYIFFLCSLFHYHQTSLKKKKKNVTFCLEYCSYFLNNHDVLPCDFHVMARVNICKIQIYHIINVLETRPQLLFTVRIKSELLLGDQPHAVSSIVSRFLLWSLISRQVGHSFLSSSPCLPYVHVLKFSSPFLFCNDCSLSL